MRIADRCGASGRWIAHARSSVLDLIVERTFSVANNLAAASGVSDKADNTWSIIALGGYGRRELAPFSDLDLLFLYTGRGSGRTRQLVERILPLLWDSGLVVGHSHSMHEAIRQSYKRAPASITNCCLRQQSGAVCHSL